jgi:hypothetical protein
LSALDPRAAALLAPVQPLIEAGLVRLGLPYPPVSLGPCAGLWRLDDEGLVLHEQLASDGPPHPYDAQAGAVGLDRWARAVACVLEGALYRSEARSEAPAWVELGWCVWRVHLSMPELNLLGPELSCALRDADLHTHPRAGAAVFAAWTSLGTDAPALLDQARQTGKVPMRALLDAGRHLLTEPAVWVHAGSPERSAPVDVPASLPPWSWRRVEVPAHPRGGRITVEGVGGVAPAWAPAGQVQRSIAASGPAGCTLQPTSGGPTGRWELRTAQGFGQIYGARGIEFVFHPSGKLEVVLADAFVGTVAEVEVSERVGTSGTATGRWRVAGPSQLTLHDIVPMGLTLHGRDDNPFVAPADGVGMGVWLRAMEGAVWRWRWSDGRLYLHGPMWGQEVELRLAGVG